MTTLTITILLLFINKLHLWVWYTLLDFDLLLQYYFTFNFVSQLSNSLVNSRHFFKNEDVQYNRSSGLKILVSGWGILSELIVYYYQFGLTWPVFSSLSDLCKGMNVIVKMETESHSLEHIWPWSKLLDTIIAPFFGQLTFFSKLFYYSPPAVGFNQN